ncbi:MAG: SDR family oxidoreductase [Planctomycetes bacterium]|nr:SDR family oxidoreductase [Planctomycetota bacterium]
MKEAPLPSDVLPPSRYIEKVSLLTGEVLPDDIQPKQLLVHNHRDFHVVDVYARYLMARAVQKTGDPDLVLRRMKEARQLGKKAVDVVASVLGTTDKTSIGKRLFGLKDKEYYFRFKRAERSAEETQPRLAALRKAAGDKLGRASENGRPAYRVLLTGGTGFLGKEILAQAADDDDIRELVVVIRGKELRDRKTKAVLRVVPPAERGAELLRQLWLEDHPKRAKFRFVDGDIEAPHLGIAADERARLRSTLTHVIHCAASVSFDDPYDLSFRANVLGALNALRFSLELQEAAGSPFVGHLSIETSYVHGRQAGALASEEELVFPRNFYNNYYELTKAMGSIETDRFLAERGLRVTQLCPAIVIGDSRNGNNRGDTKVVNAPINTFGRAKQALECKEGSWADRSRARVIARMACVFPADPSAELNLVPVDRVVAGILAALRKPDAVGSRIHLATDHRLTSGTIQQVAAEEIEVSVKLAEPTLHRNVTLPLLTKVLTSLDQPKLAGALKTLGSIFGSYSEWGQPVHEVGNDVDILGLPLPRPNTEHVFRMLCRHNRYVQNFGAIRDLDEISRREREWTRFVSALAERTGAPAGALTAAAFRKAMAAEFDLEAFKWKGAAGAAGGGG